MKESMNMDYIPALAILCQGYLASHYPNPDATSGVVKDTLDSIGWNNEFVKLDSGMRIAEIAASKKEETEKSFWWMEVFNKDDLTSKMEDEFGRELPEVISMFLKKLNSGAKITNPELVAQVYFELRSIFNQEPQ